MDNIKELVHFLTAHPKHQSQPQAYIHAEYVAHLLIQQIRSVPNSTIMEMERYVHQLQITVQLQYTIPTQFVPTKNMVIVTQVTFWMIIEEQTIVVC